MAQASLSPGPGNYVQDTLVPVLIGTVVSGGQPTKVSLTATNTVAYKKVNYLWDEAQIVVETGTITSADTDTTGDIVVFAADDSSGTNAIEVAKFGTLEDGTGDDDATLSARVRILKPYLGAVCTIAGTTPVVPITVTVRDKDWDIDATRGVTV